MTTSVGEKLGKEVTVLDKSSAAFLAESSLPKPEPFGTSSFQDVYDDYLKQVKGATGAQCFVLDGFSDIQSCRIATLAVADGSEAPVVALLLLGEDGRLAAGGTDLATAAIILSRLSVSAVGMVGTGDVAKDLGALRSAAKVTSLPLAYRYGQAGKTEEDAGAEMERLVQAGVGVFTGLEGTVGIAGQPLKKREVEKALRVASSSRWAAVGGGRPTVAIGERINPTGRKKLREALAAGDMSIVENDARTQTEAGADILDVNVGVPGAEEIPLMVRALDTVMSQSELPVSIDSSDPEVIERALQLFPGKALINSVNGEEVSMSKILPLAQRYGAAVVGLCLDETGVPIDCATRVAVAEKIVSRATSLGIPREDMMIDCLVVTAGAQQEGVVETVKAVREVSERLGLNTVLGLSNVSFGLPERRALNTAFTAMCIGAGLTAGIVDITNPDMKQTILAADVLANRDEFAGRYIAYFRSLPKPE